MENQKNNLYNIGRKLLNLSIISIFSLVAFLVYYMSIGRGERVLKNSIGKHGFGLVLMTAVFSFACYIVMSIYKKRNNIKDLRILKRIKIYKNISIILPFINYSIFGITTFDFSCGPISCENTNYCIEMRGDNYICSGNGICKRK